MTVLRDLLSATLDGEWGKGEPDNDTVEMSAIRGTDFDEVRVGSVEKVPTRFLASRHASRKTLQPNDIVFETAGGSKDRPTGRSLLLTPSRLARFERPVTCASFARFLRIAPNIANPAFTFWMLQHLYNNHELLRFHTQHTGVARYQFTIFADTYQLRLPPLDVQRRIADILSAYDDLIEVNTRRIAILDEMARRLFDEWFGITASGGRDGVLGDIAALGGNSIAPGASPERTYAHFSIPAYDEARLPHLEAGAKIMSNKLEFRPPAVLVSKLNPRIPRIWRVVSAPHAPAICSTEFLPLHPKLPVGTAWLTAFCTSHLFLGAIRGLAQGTSTSHQRAKPADVLGLPIYIPTEDLVQQAEHVLSSNYDLANCLRLSNNNLRAARDLLLPKLISGEIDLERAERELEAAE